MNDINELTEIIKELGGKATLEQILGKYCKKYHMIQLSEYKNIVKNTLVSNIDKVIFETKSELWSLNNNSSNSVFERIFLAGSPEWFRQKASDPKMVEIQCQHDILRAQFKEKFSPANLKQMNGRDLLVNVFNTSSGLLYQVLVDEIYRDFGAGSKFPYIWPIRFDQASDTCKIFSNSKGRDVPVTEAETRALNIRDQLIRYTEEIDIIASFDSISDYELLEKKTKSIYFADHLWTIKYLQMIYPEVFPQMYADQFVKRFLIKFGLQRHGSHRLLNYGEISLYRKKCAIPIDSFTHVFADEWGWNNDDLEPCMYSKYCQGEK